MMSFELREGVLILCVSWLYRQPGNGRIVYSPTRRQQTANREDGRRARGEVKKKKNKRNCLYGCTLESDCALLYIYSTCSARTIFH